MKLHTIILSIAALLCAACLTGTGQAEVSRVFYAMDTVMTIASEDADPGMLDVCESEVARLERLMSVTDPESELARLNALGTAKLSDETLTALRFALEIAELTDGALDVTLYPIVRAWGFTTGEYRVPTDEEISALLDHVGWRKVQLDGDTASLPEGTKIDLGALAKGYASERLAAILSESGVTTALIDLGGNVYGLGGKADGTPWRVGVRDPEDRDAMAGAIEIRDAAVVTSGNYERCFTGTDGKVYGHIFDPATGRPAQSGLMSVTVVGASGLECDALCTALYVMGIDRACALLETLRGVSAILIGDNHMMYVSDGLFDRFTPMGRYADAEIHWIG